MVPGSGRGSGTADDGPADDPDVVEPPVLVLPPPCGWTGSFVGPVVAVLGPEVDGEATAADSLPRP